MREKTSSNDVVWLTKIRTFSDMSQASEALTCAKLIHSDQCLSGGIEMKYAMKLSFSLFHVTAVAWLISQCGLAQTGTSSAQIVTLALNPRDVTVLHLRKGYVSSVRLPEEVTSVVVGDPGTFKAEHSEAEPQLVFFKPASAKPAETNALITTRSGHEVSLSLVSEGSRGGPVDYVLKYEPARSLVIRSAYPSFLIAETRSVTQGSASKTSERAPVEASAAQWLREQHVKNPHWLGKSLKISVGKSLQSEAGMTVAFSVKNSSSRAIELMAPQIQLGSQFRKKGKAVKAEQVPIKYYQFTTNNLEPGARADGVVIFDRPSFKESEERLLLKIADAEEVDRPVLAPVAFVAQVKGAPQ
jgi:type IV secretory pathway VirB9-like protein